VSELDLSSRRLQSRRRRPRLGESGAAGTPPVPAFSLSSVIFLYRRAGPISSIFAALLRSPLRKTSCCGLFRVAPPCRARDRASARTNRCRDQQVGFNKASGVRELMSHPPFAAGARFHRDDITDETVLPCCRKSRPASVGRGPGRSLLRRSGGVRSGARPLSANAVLLAMIDHGSTCVIERAHGRVVNPRRASRVVLPRFDSDPISAGCWPQRGKRICGCRPRRHGRLQGGICSHTPIVTRC